ncbi:sterol desaturase family protein [Tenacibaculum xiamenense]|uniref:sterol desaturase family protein n=1 Tax=Tenacibaculum xiamenense TaxID=1261553 RepID=UPI0038952218
MNHTKILSYTVVPILISIISLLVYWIIKTQFSYELGTYFIFLFTTAYLLFFERIIPFNPEWKVSKKTISIEIKHFLFSTAIIDALANTLSLSLVLYLKATVFKTTIEWDILPFWISLILAAIIGEFFPYVYHRYSHVGSITSKSSIFFWKIHAIHHIPTSINWFKTNWIHPLNTFLNVLFKMLPLLVLGFNEEILFIIGIINIVVGYLSHANIKANTGILDYIIITPKLHHFHHSIKLEEAKNYGNTLPFWDLVFNTYYNRKGSVDKVGVSKSEYLQYPDINNYMKQLLFPFQTKECCKLRKS